MCSRTTHAEKWAEYRGWFGTFAENVVQGTARDLLAAALERFETRGIPIVLHVHDEVVAEVPVGSITETEFLAILLEPPIWATGLPLAGTVWSEHLGHRVAAMLSHKLAEGVITAIRTARLGLATMAACRPLPFGEAEQPTLASLRSQVIKGLSS